MKNLPIYRLLFFIIFILFFRISNLNRNDNKKCQNSVVIFQNSIRNAIAHAWLSPWCVYGCLGKHMLNTDRVDMVRIRRDDVFSCAINNSRLYARGWGRLLKVGVLPDSYRVAILYSRYSPNNTTAEAISFINTTNRINKKTLHIISIPIS